MCECRCWRQPPMSSSSMKLIYKFMLQPQKRLSHICVGYVVCTSFAYWILDSLNDANHAIDGKWHLMFFITEWACLYNGIRSNTMRKYCYLFKMKQKILWCSFSARRQRWQWRQCLVDAFHLIIDFLFYAAIWIFMSSHFRRICEKSSIHHCIINHCVVCFCSTRSILNGGHEAQMRLGVPGHRWCNLCITDNRHKKRENSQSISNE